MMFLRAVPGWVTMFNAGEVWRLDVQDLVTEASNVCWALVSIAFFTQLLRPKRSWLLWVPTVLLVLELTNNTLDTILGIHLGGKFNNVLFGLFFFVLHLWVVMVVFGAARRKSEDAMLLLIPVFLSTVTYSLQYVLMSTYGFGCQHWTVGSLTITQTPFEIDSFEVTEAIFLLAVFGILILRFTRTRSEEERLASEVHSARSVQQYLIPAHLPLTPGFKLESEYMPAREVGGDFFQVLPIASDGGVPVVVGDVAGKGLEAGMLATLIVGAIRTAVAFTGDAGTILALLNERLQGRGLVTCLALRMDGEGNATLVNAGHLPPYLNGTELEMEGALPLGAIPGVEFPVLRFHLSEGDSLVLMSDGIVEAQKADGELFGFERVGKMLRASATAGELAAAARDFGQEDDITVLSVARAAVLVTA